MARPKTTKVTCLDYCQYVFSSQANYTLTNFSEHVADLSHDMINRYLRDEHLTASLVWEHTQPTICQNENGFVVFDDSILDKNHSRKLSRYDGNTVAMRTVLFGE